jgi:hypothetical protein
MPPLLFVLFKGEDHYCPTVVIENFDKDIKSKKLSMKPGVIDLKFFIPSGYSSISTWKGANNEFRKNHFCSTDQISADLRISSMHPTVPRRLQSSNFFLLGSIPTPGAP